MTLSYISAVRSPQCSEICETIGYQDDWAVMEIHREAKTFLSLTCCVQLLKIMKLAAILVPKMGLAPAVLKKALPGIDAGTQTPHGDCSQATTSHILLCASCLPLLCSD